MTFNPLTVTSSQSQKLEKYCALQLDSGDLECQHPQHQQHSNKANTYRLNAAYTHWLTCGCPVWCYHRQYLLHLFLYMVLLDLPRIYH
jgi:hypothetical protein